MSKGQTLRTLVKQRLTAAVEEIFGLFERTIVEYEEELCRSKEENERQRQILDAVLKPQLRLHRADVQPLSCKEEVQPEEKEGSLMLVQEDPPEHTIIKEEQDELLTGQEDEYLEELEEAEFTKFPSVFVKSEYGKGEKASSSQLDESQGEQIETEADEEDCGGPESAMNQDPDRCLPPYIDDTINDCLEPELEVSIDDGTASDHLNLMKNMRDSSCEKQFRCSECGKLFNQNSNLKTHMRIHTGEKPFSCPVCGKKFGQKAHLQSHLKCHTGEKPFSCSLCNKCFSRFEHLQLHMRTHTGEKPFFCTVCNRRFTWLYQFKNHKCGSESSQLHELWTNQELHEQENADSQFTFAPDLARGAEGYDKPQSSQLLQKKTEHMKGAVYGQEYNGPEPASNYDADSRGSQGLTCNPFIREFW